MNRLKKIALLGIVVLAPAYMFATGTFSIFEDRDVATTTFTAGMWCRNTIESLSIDACSARLTGDSRNLLHGIWLNSSEDVTIKKVSINWRYNNDENVTKISIGEGNEGNFWSGNSNAGEFSGKYFLEEDKQKMNTYSFDGDMSGKIFTIGFSLDGNTFKSVIFKPNWR